MIELGAYNFTWDKHGFDLLSLRSTEFTLATGDSSGNVYAIFNTKPDAILEAGLSIATTAFICLVLAGGALTFQKDSDKMVIYPI